MQKGPDAVGQVNDRVIGANNPQPYLMGRAYTGGIQVHDVGYGGTVDDIQNPFRFIAAVDSCCGPLEELESHLLDFSAVTFSSGNAVGYYHDWLYMNFQVGQRPEADALNIGSTPIPDWGSSYKLSGYGAAAYVLVWSKKGKRFAGGQIPTIGRVWKGVKAYDPRLDSTYPGGSGAQRITDESTWAYSRNPALHALAYAYGRYVNGMKVFGADLGASGIDLSDIVAWANTCDTNGWTVNGTIYEPGDKWNNLKRICEAGGAVPVMRGGILGFDWQAPRTSLHTVTKDDLADGVVPAKLSKGWKNRHNTLVPRFRSESHQWNYTQAEAVQVAAWVTADGEEKTDERQWDLVTDVDQVTQLATYDLYQRREAGPFKLPCKPHMRDYGPGDCLTLSEELGVHPAGAVKAIVRSRSIDLESGVVTLEFEQETDAKHTAALGLTGSATTAYTPPTGEEMDDAAATNSEPAGYVRLMILNSFVTDADPADGLIEADDTGSPCTITIEDHTRTYPDEETAVAVTGAVLTTEDDGTTAFVADGTKTYHIYYDDYGRAGDAVTLLATLDSELAVNSGAHPGRHYLGSITPEAGVVVTSAGAAPPGWDPDVYCVADDTPILLATGRMVPAADLEVGALLRTQHEDTLEWGTFAVSAIAFAEEPVVACRIAREQGSVTIRATADHRFHIGGEWVRAGEIGTPAGKARVAKITVADAHTYVSAGVLSHNIKA